MNVDSLTCHSNMAPTVWRPMSQTVNQPNDLYLRKLGLEPGSMHSPRSRVQYSIDCAKLALWLVGYEVTQPAMASIPLLTPHSHTAVVYSGPVRHPIWPWPYNLTQRSDSKVFFLRHFVFLAVICFFWPFLTLFEFLMCRKLRCTPPKMSSQSEGCITECKEMTFDLLQNARSDLIGRECLLRHVIFTLTFGAEIHYSDISKGR